MNEIKNEITRMIAETDNSSLLLLIYEILIRMV